MIESQKAKSFFELVPDKKTLVILGGSLGALKINELIALKLTYFNSQGWQVIWQCGKLYYSEYQSKGFEQTKYIHLLIEWTNSANRLLISL